MISEAQVKPGVSIKGPLINAVVCGVVSGEPVSSWSYGRERKIFLLKAFRIRSNDRLTYEKCDIPVIATYYEKDDIHSGDRVMLKGDFFPAIGPVREKRKVKMNAGTASGVLRCRSKGLYLIETGKGPFMRMRRWITGFRGKAYRVFKKYLPGRERALLSCLILGIRNELPPEIISYFKKTGTMHILAVSGLHIGLFTVFLLFIFRALNVPKNIIYLAAIPFVIFFAVFTGARPSSLRAALMGCFMLFGLHIRNKIDLLNSIAFSALILAIINPLFIIRTGFILSYAAVLSIVLFLPLFEEVLSHLDPGTGNDIYGWRMLIREFIIRNLSVTASVCLGILPITAYFFNLITPSVFPANLIAIPALFMLLILGAVLLLSGGVSFLDWLCRFSAYLIHKLTAALIVAIKVIAHLPFSNFRISSPGPVFFVLYYLSVTACMIYFRRARKTRLTMVFLFLVLSDLLLWQTVVNDRTDPVRVTFFSEGKADSALIELPRGGIMLVDGGHGISSRTKAWDKDRLIPYMRAKGIRKIDCIVLSHSHEDHIGGFLDVLEDFKVGTVIEGAGTGEKSGSEMYNVFNGLIRKKGVRRIKVRRGDRLEYPGGVTMLVFNPGRDRLYDDINEDSLVFKLTSQKGNSILFAGDVRDKALEDLIMCGDPLKANMVKVPHHGAVNGRLFKRLLDVTECRLVIIPNADRWRLAPCILKIAYEGEVKTFITGETGKITFYEDEGWQLLP